MNLILCVNILIEKLGWRNTGNIVFHEENFLSEVKPSKRSFNTPFVCKRKDIVFVKQIEDKIYLLTTILVLSPKF